MTKTRVNLIAKTHVGMVRGANEDNFIISKSPDLPDWVVPEQDYDLPDLGTVFVVADGMGGAEAGEVASELTVNTIKEFLSLNLKNAKTDQNITDCLKQGLILSHEIVKQYAVDNPESFGLGTTATICYIKENKLYISWIGDSRVYRFSKAGRVTAHSFNAGHLEQLTDDHSVVWQEVLKGKMSPEESRTAPNSNIITQSIGDVYRPPSPDARIYPVYQDDIILSCSDGLNGMLSDHSIEHIIDEHSNDPNLLVNKLIDSANQAGGKDNITVALCTIINGPLFVVDQSKDSTYEYVPISDPRPWYLHYSLFFLVGLAGLIFYLYKTSPELFDFLDSSKSKVEQVDEAESVIKYERVEIVDPVTAVDSTVVDTTQVEEKPTVIPTKKKKVRKPKKKRVATQPKKPIDQQDQDPEVKLRPEPITTQLENNPVPADSTLKNEHSKLLNKTDRPNLAMSEHDEVKERLKEIVLLINTNNLGEDNGMTMVNQYKKLVVRSKDTPLENNEEKLQKMIKDLDVVINDISEFLKNKI